MPHTVARLKLISSDFYQRYHLFTFVTGDTILHLTLLPTGTCFYCCPIQLNRDVQFLLYTRYALFMNQNHRHAMYIRFSRIQFSYFNIVKIENIKRKLIIINQKFC